MRVISLVPSWTETLLEAGVEVVGRSRFCVHPKDRVKDIPAVGGTKDVNWELVGRLKADILLLDREENTKTIADQSPLRIVDTHVESLESLVLEFKNLAKVFNNTLLKTWSEELLEILNAPKPEWNWSKIPAFLEWIKKPEVTPDKFIYLIWRDPWMSIGHQTFIGSMIEHLGGRPYQIVFNDKDGAEVKYPKIHLEDFNPKSTLLLCSTEPYPFAKKKHEMNLLENSSALVDGESYSWFGIRSLRFLTAQNSRQP